MRSYETNKEVKPGPVLMALRLVLAGIMLCLIFSPSTLAENINFTCQSASIGEYATFGFCLPQNITAMPGGIVETNYSSGKVVSTSLQLPDNGIVNLHLLYPCSIEPNLSLDGIRSALEAYDPRMEYSAIYNTAGIQIGDRIAVSGVDIEENRTFVAYQPSNSTVSIITFDSGFRTQMIRDFLATLHITADVPLLPSGYCTKANVSAASKTTAGPSTSSYLPSEESQLIPRGPEADARAARLEASLEQLNTEREAALDRLGETREQLGGWNP